jgi:hypothetical protein
MNCINAKPETPSSNQKKKTLEQLERIKESEGDDMKEANENLGKLIDDALKLEV